MALTTQISVFCTKIHQGALEFLKNKQKYFHSYRNALVSPIF